MTPSLRANGYPDKFIKDHKIERPKRTSFCSVEKGRVINTLPFKGGRLFNRISENLKCALKHTYSFAKTFRTSKGFAFQRQSTRAPELTTFHILPVHLKLD